ncbi:MAG: hypothetical protein EOO04_25045 [Chitinophagaceae bacterium]|nr:MAG: hypothetical protein EOO04_25045 [Chitinophagaceae bacterium]
MNIRFLIFCFVTVGFINSINAQITDTYHSDLNQLSTILKKLPSYKAQIKGKKLKEFNALYSKLYNDTAQLVTHYDAFERLSQLFFLLKDNHLAFYQLPGMVLTPAQLQDTIAIRQYRSSSSFLQFPHSTIDIDSLQQVLSNLSPDSIAGVYHYDRYLMVGLYKSAPTEYTGIVLSATLPHWDPGQIAIRLYENQLGGYHAIYAHPLNKNFFLYQIEKFRNRSLVNSYFYASVSDGVYRKSPADQDFVNIPRTASAFANKILSPGVQYIRLGNFSNSAYARKESMSFLERIKDSLKAPNLIIDLRNNTGGASAVSRKFLKLVKSYLRNGRIYLLHNNATMSRGEIFLLQLKRKRNVSTFGQTTNGTLAYGSNWGKTEKLPSGTQQVYVTDMKSSASRLQYENTGILPGVWFENDGDWIEKLLNLISKDQKN